jgi:MFS family permease
VLCLAQFVVALDYSIIYVALPSIGDDLGLGPSLLQWVVSAYAVLFAGLLLVGGRVADRFGAKRVFVVAFAVFGLASALGGVAGDGTALLGARGLQGLAAAFLQPAILGLLSATFADGPVRARALSIWGAVGASGLAVGVVLGGVLTALSWRWTFLINAPLAAVGVIGASPWIVTSRKKAASSRIPLRAALLGTGALLSTVVTLTLLADTRTPWAVFAVALATAVTLIVSFLFSEHSSANVLIERPLRRLPSLRLGVAATFLYMASVGSEFYLVTLLLQKLEGFTPLEAGLGFLPLAALVTVGNIVAGKLVPRWSAGVTLATGFGISTIGLGTFVGFLGSGNYATNLLPGLLLSGFGHGIIYTSMFVIGTRDIPADLQGSAGALLTTSQYLSAAVSVALLTIVLGADPQSTQFRWAFFVTTIAAFLGITVGLLVRRYGSGRKATR